MCRDEKSFSKNAAQIKREGGCFSKKKNSGEKIKLLISCVRFSLRTTFPRVPSKFVWITSRKQRKKNLGYPFFHNGLVGIEKKKIPCSRFSQEIQVFAPPTCIGINRFLPNAPFLTTFYSLCHLSTAMCLFPKTTPIQVHPLSN